MKSALQIALDGLSRKAMTQCELEKRLQDKKFGHEEIALTLSKLIEWGYIDDYRLAIDYCRTRSERYSRLRIRENLRSRGLDKALIDEILVNNYSQEQEFQQCLALAQQNFQRDCIRFKEDIKRGKLESPIFRANFLQQKAGRKLARLGYSYEMINKVLEIISNGKLVT